MNTALTALLHTCPANDMRRWRFSLACIQRVQHLLESEEVIERVAVLEHFAAGTCGRAMLDQAAIEAAALATRHPGSRSLDGAAHAAVSASHAVARALAGRVEDAAAYAAYAMVYAYAGHAVTDPAAFAGEHAWQMETWNALKPLAGAPFG